MRSRISLVALVLMVGSFTLPHLAHAAIPFLGPIVPDSIGKCAAGWGALMIVVNNIIQFMITLVLVFVAPIMIAYSGFLMVTSQGNSAGLNKAKGVLVNTVAGLVIALSAWLIIDAVMAVLYSSPGGAWGTWSSLIGSGGDVCLPQKGFPGSALNQSGASLSTGSGFTSSVGQSAVQCSNGNTACSPAALQAAGFSQTQANVMSCIAVTESGGNPGVGCNGNACGTFQIMLTKNPLVGSACAKYNNGNPTLNCPALCKGSRGAAVTTSSCQSCVQAASDAQCNAQSAQNLVSQSGYTPWTCAGCNSRAAACVQKYGNG